MKKDLEIIIFLGAIWGIIEATLGYLLHATSFAVGGSILFPIGFYIMKKAYNASGNLKTIFLTSVVASLIKLVDLAMPVTTIYKVINPAISILFEGLIVLAVYYVIQNKEKFSKYKSLQALALGLGWRTMYLAYLLFLPANIIKVSPIGSSPAFFKFLVIEGLINSAIIYLYLKFAQTKSQEKPQYNFHLSPSLAFLLLFAAIFIQIKI